MNPKSIVVILAIAAMPVCAQAQQSKTPPKATKADAQKVIKLVSGDKAKIRLYCDIAKLGDEIDEAVEKKDEKKVDELSLKADELGKKIGPEYIALMDGLQEMDPNSRDSEEIGTMLEALDKLCEK